MRKKEYVWRGMGRDKKRGAMFSKMMRSLRLNKLEDLLIRRGIRMMGICQGRYPSSMFIIVIKEVLQKVIK